MRSIAVVTVARSDYSIYRPILFELNRAEDVRLVLLVGGTHWSPRFGTSVDAILADGFSAIENVDTLPESDSPEEMAGSAGRAVAKFAAALEQYRPDWLLLLGDRYEMLAAALAASFFRIAVGHVHGGERSEGSLDESYRHAITKLSHLHFVSTEAYRRRVIQLGEEPWRVHCTGAPALDALSDVPPLSRAQLEEQIGIPAGPYLLCTYHGPSAIAPTTELDAMLAALEATELPIVFTSPGLDAGSATIRARLAEFVAERPLCRLIDHAGFPLYPSLMAQATAMVGNSSSGIIEAATFRLPVVNIGERQRGRVAPANVLTCAGEQDAIARALSQAIAPAFRQSLAGLQNPHWAGGAAPKIVRQLRQSPLDDTLIQKRFHDLPVEGGP